MIVESLSFLTPRKIRIHARKSQEKTRHSQNFDNKTLKFHQKILNTFSQNFLFGDGGCGKTCLLTVFSKDVFPETYVPTVFENDVKDITVDGTTVELALWDTAGQEGFARLRQISYRGADVILIAFSVDNPDSFANISNYWLPEVKEHCPKVPFMIVATKTDLRGEEEETIEPVKGKELNIEKGGKGYARFVKKVF